MPLKHLLINVAIGALLWVAILAALVWGHGKASADHQVCPELTIPIQVQILDPYPTPWRSWMNYINAKAGVTVFEETTTGGDAYIMPLEWFYGDPAYYWLSPTGTQVIMTCTQAIPFILVDDATDNWEWAPHELLHVSSGLGDHIYWHFLNGGGPPRQGWIDPRQCDVPSAPLYSDYEGVASYCTPASLWFQTQDDIEMLARLW